MENESRRVLTRPRRTLWWFFAVFALCLALAPLIGRSFFPRTDAGQLVISVKAPSGTKLTTTEGEIARLEALVHETIEPGDLGMIVSKYRPRPGLLGHLLRQRRHAHGVRPQVSLAEGHRLGSFEYIDRRRQRISAQMPELTTFFSSGSLVDAVVNMGMPAPLDLEIEAAQTSASDDRVALDLAEEIRRVPGVAETYVPQDLDYPSLKLDVDRVRAGELGLSEKEVVTNVVTALDTNQMIAPIVWNDPKSGNNYYINVQYPEQQVQSLGDLSAIPLHGAQVARSTRLGMVGKLTRFDAPTEVDHDQIRRKIDVYVRPDGEDLGRVADAIDRLVAAAKLPEGTDVAVRGTVGLMRASFRSFGVGLLLVRLAALHSSWSRSSAPSSSIPWIILLALPAGLAGVVLTLLCTGTTLNVMSLTWGL